MFIVTDIILSSWRPIWYGWLLLNCF